MNESIDDQLKRLNAEFDKLLNTTSEEPENNLQRLIRFGLSEGEAQAWLNQEPNYSRQKVTRIETDEDETEPIAETYRGGLPAPALQPLNKGGYSLPLAQQQGNATSLKLNTQ